MTYYHNYHFKILFYRTIGALFPRVVVRGQEPYPLETKAEGKLLYITSIFSFPASHEDMSGTAGVNTSRALYKHLLREVGRLPPEARPHYKHHVRQGFNQHRDETDPERVQQIISQAMKDAVWLVNKVNSMVTMAGSPC